MIKCTAGFLALVSLLGTAMTAVAQEKARTWAQMNPDQSAYWLLFDENKEFLGAAPKGDPDIFTKMLPGYTIQEVPIMAMGNLTSPNLDNVKRDLKNTAEAIKSEVCENMADWDEVSFTIHTSVLGQGKLTAQGTFTPSKVCNSQNNASNN